jgi:chemotaxis signal transduction protein
MEIIEFYLGIQPFGINVHKLKEIIPFDWDVLTVISGSGEGMLGTLLLRDIKVVMFSSLINEEMNAKWTQAGAESIQSNLRYPILLK